MKFIPKFKDKSLIDSNINEFFVDADVVFRNHKAFDELVKKVPNYTINPITNRLPYNSNGTIEKLSFYFPKSDFQQILNDSSFRLHKLITPSIDFLIEKGSKNIIPPYFYVTDVTSLTFNVNIENITNVVKYREQMKASFPITPVIHISSNLLTDENALRYIVSVYLSDEISENIDSIYLIIDNFNPDKSESHLIEGYLKLVSMLEPAGLHILFINTFGYIPLLLGAKTMISGLGSNEGLNVENWQIDTSDSDGPRGRPAKFTYVPEIFAYIDEIELQKMNYKCNCDYCKDALPKTAQDKKKHFLECRKRDIQKIFIGTFDENVGQLNTILLEAKKTAIDMLRKKQITRPESDILTPLNKRLDVLGNIAQFTNLKEAEELLSKILEDLNEDN